ncbi:MAG: hypothetical protein AB7O50_11920 [Pseudolabrys sp.]
MRICLARTAILAIAAAAMIASAAAAATLADFNAAAERAAAHYRVALGYLRTGNTDLAALEVERMRETWSAISRDLAQPPPELSKDVQLYRNTMLDISTRLVTASIMIDTGRPQIAADALRAIRNGLSDLRKANGVVVLADCVRDANTAMDALYVYNDRNLDWSRAGIAGDIAVKATAYGAILKRCDGLADSATRANPEFRRLIDGAAASLAQMPKATETRDAGLLHRLLIELRAFDHLLAFRHG